MFNATKKMFNVEEKNFTGLKIFSNPGNKILSAKKNLFNG